MKKFIITTTINKPTEATLKFCEIAENKNFKFVIIGDLSTPHEEYYFLERKFKNVTYLTPEQQEKLYPELSNIIGLPNWVRQNEEVIKQLKKKKNINDKLPVNLLAVS
jgi:thioredoxin reductase